MVILGPHAKCQFAALKKVREIWYDLSGKTLVSRLKDYYTLCVRLLVCERSPREYTPYGRG